MPDHSIPSSRPNWRHNRRFRHGWSDTPEYYAWTNLKRRCTDPTRPGWKNYGGRGITVCDRWRHCFPNFLADMGPRPSPKHSVDRIDNDGGYWCGHCFECVLNERPANCRWATRTQQNRNRPRINRILEHDGLRLTVAEWAERLNIDQSTLLRRLTRGWSVERTLTLPVKAGQKAHGCGATLSYARHR